MTQAFDRHALFMAETNGDAYTVGPLQSGPPAASRKPQIQVEGSP